MRVGYKVSFPFFDDDMKLVEEETNRVSFYKLVFPPNHSNLYIFAAPIVAVPLSR